MYPNDRPMSEVHMAIRPSALCTAFATVPQLGVRQRFHTQMIVVVPAQIRCTRNGRLILAKAAPCLWRTIGEKWPNYVRAVGR